MRLIDADELMEHATRDKLDSRELILQMIENAPTIDGEKKLAQEIYNIIFNLEDSFRFIPRHTDKEVAQHLNDILMEIYIKIKPILRS